jgi:hypothetical protein
MDVEFVSIDGPPPGPRKALAGHVERGRGAALPSIRVLKKGLDPETVGDPFGKVRETTQVHPAGVLGGVT